MIQNWRAGDGGLDFRWLFRLMRFRRLIFLWVISACIFSGLVELEVKRLGILVQLGYVRKFGRVKEPSVGN